MNPTQVLVLLLQTSFILISALGLGALARRKPELRSAIYRLALVAVLTLALGSPWLGERPHPVVPVQWRPTFVAVSAVPTKPQAASNSSVRKEETAKTEAAVVADSQIDPVAYIPGVWAVGILLLALNLGLGFLRLWQIRKGCSRVEDARVLGILADIAKLARVPRPDLVEGDTVANPFVAGVFRKTLYLPKGWAEKVDEDVLRAVLRHEVAHLANGDLFWNLLYRLACIALWPQPLLWLMRRPMSSASEELCDRHVLASGMSDARYAECLLNLRESVRMAPCPSLGIGAVSRSSLSKRVEAILDPKRSRTVILPRSLALALRIGALALAASAVFIFAKPAASGQAQDPFAGWISKPYNSQIRILDSAGKAVSGATAWLELSGDLLQPQARVLKVSGSAVTLTTENVPPRTTATLVVQAKGYGLGFVRLWPTPTEITDITLPESVSVTGRLKLPDGRPAAGIKVGTTLLVRQRSGPVPVDFVSTQRLVGLQLGATTASDGTFHIDGLAPNCTVGFEADDDRFAQFDYSDRVQTAASGDTKPKDITLAEAAQLTGVVTRDGKPVAGLFVGAQSNHEIDPQKAESWGDAVTDANGRYTIRRLQAGAYNVIVGLDHALEQEVTAAAHEGVVAKAGQTVTGLDFQLVPGVVVEGRVTDESGAPLNEVAVGAYGPSHPETSAWVQSALTDKDGRYHLRVPPGKQRIYLADSRYSAPHQRVTVEEGKTATIDFRAKIAEQETALATTSNDDVVTDPPKQEETGPVPPVASFGPGKPFYGPVRLPGGAVVRLAYVQDDSDNPHTLWSPDGGPAAKADVAQSLNMSGFSDRHRNPRSIFLRVEIEGVPRGSYDCQVEVPHSSAWNVWQTYGDGEGGTMDLASFHAPVSLKITEMKFGVASGPLRVVASGKLGEAPLFASAKPGSNGDFDVSLSVHIPSGLEGKEILVDAYDRSGKKLTLAMWESEDRKDGTRHFGLRGAAPEDVSHVDLVVRDYQWTTFKGIHLYPSQGH